MKHLPCFYLFLFQIIIFLTVSSCKKNFNLDSVKDLEWKPDVIIPLVNDSISFESAIPLFGTDKNFFIDEEGNVSLLYYFRNEAFKISASDLLILPPFTFGYSHEITLAEQQLLKIQDLVIPPFTFPIDLSSDNPDILVNKMLVKKGSIIVNATNSFDNDGYQIVSIPNATKNGIPFSDTIRPFVSGNSSDTIDLAEVSFDLSSSPNSTAVVIDGVLIKSNEFVVGDITNSNYDLVIDQIERFEGFLGQKTFPEAEESVRVTIFNNTGAMGNMYFVEPSISITIYNSIGAPAENIVTGLRATNALTGDSLDIAGRLGTNAVIAVESPDINTGQPVIKTVDYSNENTENSMGDFFNVKPYYVFFKINTTFNPTGQVVNFFSDTSTFYARLLVRLPLFGHFDNLFIQDTFKFSIGSTEDIELIEFRTHIVNGLPLQAKMQVYFVDVYNNKLDSLTEDNVILINEAPVDPSTFLPYDGMFGLKDTSFFFYPDKIKKIENAENIFLKAILQSSEGGQENVKIKANQSLKLNFSALAHMRKNLGTGDK
jgi:hypothetical protein